MSKLGLTVSLTRAIIEREQVSEVKSMFPDDWEAFRMVVEALSERK